MNFSPFDSVSNHRESKQLVTTKDSKATNGVQDALLIINTIGDQWEFLLVLTFIVFLVVYRKKIGILISRAQKLEVAGQKVEFNQIHGEEGNSIQPGAAASIIDEKKIQLKESNKDSNNMIADQNPEKEKVSFSLIIESLRDSNISEANRVFNLMQESASTDLEKQKI